MKRFYNAAAKQERTEVCTSLYLTLSFYMLTFVETGETPLRSGPSRRVERCNGHYFRKPDGPQRSAQRI